MIRIFLVVLLVFSALGGASVVDGHAEAASRQERNFWRSIQGSTDPYDYEEYLRVYPYGDYAAEAERKAERLYQVQDRKSRERALRLNRGQRREVEARLARAGFPPGSINGDFNRDTRRAIRDFRRFYGLHPHRFLDRPMLRVLVAETGERYTGRETNRRAGGRDGEVAAGVVAGALLLGGIILLAD